MPKCISEEEYIEAAESNLGFCTNCQEFTHDSCEPDAHKYTCPECEENTVYGAEEALLLNLITF